MGKIKRKLIFLLYDVLIMSTWTVLMTKVSFKRDRKKGKVLAQMKEIFFLIIVKIFLVLRCMGNARENIFIRVKIT